MGHLWNQTAGTVCVGFLFIQGLKTAPNMSVYRLDYLFHTVIGVLEGHPGISRYAKDLQGGPQIMALGNGPKRD